MKLVLDTVGVERRGQVIRGLFVRSTGPRSGRSRVSELKSAGKPFEISKREVWEAWEKVKANKGAPGVDGCSVGDFEADLKNNLYKVWNRMSSGSYFPPPVLAVEIPKPHGGSPDMPSLSLDLGDAAELAEILQFLSEWLAADEPRLGASLTRFIGSDAYNLSQLRADLDRFAFLIDGTGAESLFHPGSNGAMPPGLPLDPPC